MATMVGAETTFDMLVRNLLLLEHDAIAAYDTTIDRLQDQTARDQVAAFKKDHLQHVQTLTTMASQVGIQAPEKGDAKQLLTTGKVALAGLIGDAAVLKAMRTNEEDTVTAYERACSHKEAHPESRAFFAKALADEKRHRSWMTDYSERL